MLIRNSIANTKKLFQKTIHNFKALFSRTDHDPNYEQLPKYSSSYYVPGIDLNTSADYEELERFYSGFKDQWDKSKGKKMERFKNGPVPTEYEQQVSPKQPGFCPVSDFDVSEQRSVELAGERQSSSKGGREYSKNILMVAEKLKEMEMIDKSNVDHVLDIEEVLHYYSQLTCPFYVDVVDKFFMEIIAEFYGSVAAVSTP